MNEINFFYEDIDFHLSDPELITKWVLHTFQNESIELESLNYIFCSDEYLYNINVEYLNHDYYTDVITFYNSEEGDPVEGDIFISIDRIEDNARQQSSTFLEELRRVIIHGTLHLVGYNDKTESQKAEMREKENAYLSLPQFQK